MANVVIGIIVLALVAWAVWRVVKKSKTGGGCCGEHEAAEAKVTVQGKNKRNYPYHVTMTIGGMTCENCARKVENALNSLPDTLAKVDISSKKASVYLKQEPDQKVLRHAVRSAGYSVSEII